MSELTLSVSGPWSPDLTPSLFLESVTTVPERPTHQNPSTNWRDTKPKETTIYKGWSNPTNYSIILYGRFIIIHVNNSENGRNKNKLGVIRTLHTR